MATPKKEAIVKEMAEKLQRSSAAVLADYRGLTVTEITDLRRRLGSTDTELRVIKNTLLTRAAAEAGLDFGDLLSGPTAVAIAYGDVVAPAKVFVDFLRDHKNVSVKGGLVERRFFAAEQLTALSKIPPREVLLAQLLGGLNAPISGLVGTLQGIISNLVFTLQAVADKRGEAA